MEDFLVIAASCRSIARSITEAGYKCRGLDLFADWDTARLCEVDAVSDWKMAFREAAQYSPKMQIVWGSGVDNAVLDPQHALPEDRCCAIAGSSLVRCRDPFFVASCLHQAGFPALALTRQRPTGGRWIQKPFRSGGGEGVRLCLSGDNSCVRTNEGAPPLPVYYQKFKLGSVYGATFIADSKQCALMGVCRQFHRTHRDWHFLYSGSAGPVKLKEALISKIQRLGDVVAESCGLLGWFGIDFVVNQDHPWLIEINPRYTASMEILERVSGRSFFDQHRSAFQGGAPGQTSALVVGDGSILGKQYVFWQEKEPLRITAPLQQWLIDFGHPKGFVTDIPQVETLIGPQEPVCTVWASAADCESVEQRLRKSELEVLGNINKKNASNQFEAFD